ncbi:importin-11 [Melanaphis sacchari]|uniref:Importin-11 n=1 Tax=Melanaphis sacchari TaxID=742174 RepID=A0A2H8U151_9HEMI|nr:importin-11 [Melanaphis sacchari]XP_025195676.1 importin-11 [Melanaphis sacchari]XP_025195677.1 importin-11 [Melanaphis sacchari]
MEIEQLVYETLLQASSQHPDMLKPAEQKLKEWEVEPGFYSVLFRIFSNQSLDLNVRWMSILCFKQGVEKYWRKNIEHGISEEEKVTLRKMLLTNLSEPVPRLATQVSVIIGRVARLDWPYDWEDLMPELIERIKYDPQNRALLSMHHVVKSLAGKRLYDSIRLFQNASSQLFPNFYSHWEQRTNAFIKEMEQGNISPSVAKLLEDAFYTQKILSNFVLYGFKSPYPNDVKQFILAIFNKVRPIIACRAYYPDLVEKFVCRMFKMLMAILEDHPAEYLDFIQPTVELAYFYGFTADGNTVVFERFLIQLFNLTKLILICPQYKLPRTNGPICQMDENAKRISALAVQHKASVFKSDRLMIMCQQLIYKYFLLTPAELEIWDSDPEMFATDEVGEYWKYNLKACTESLFMSLFHEFRELLTPRLAATIESNREFVDPNNLEAVLKKDAIYNAFGLTAFEMFDIINFDDWFNTTLRQELMETHGHSRVLKRRVAWLIGQWLTVRLNPEYRPELYNILIGLLNPEQDMAVRLAATSTLRCAIDDFDFSSEHFIEYLEPMAFSLYKLLVSVRECDTKLNVLHVMSFMVERLGPMVEPYFDSLLQYLPKLWTDSDDHHMLRCAIISTLTQIVRAIRTKSAELTPFLVPIIRYSVDIKEKAYIYLQEDGLELLLSYIESCATYNDEMLSLINYLLPLLDYSTEHLKTGLMILEAYVLIAPDRVISEYGTQLFSLTTSLMNDLKDEGIVCILSLYETIIKVNLPQTIELMMAILGQNLKCLCSGEIGLAVNSCRLSLIARVILNDSSIFIKVVEHLCMTENGNLMNFDNVLSRIIEVWLERMNQIVQNDRRKLLGLALASLLTCQKKPILELFKEIITVCVETLNDIMRKTDDGLYADSMLMTDDCSNVSSRANSECEYQYETEHNERQRCLSLKDPVHCIPFHKYLQSQLLALQNQIGEQQFQGVLISKVDSDILEQLYLYM